jgi:5'/3'-nucleotidase SurE
VSLLIGSGVAVAASIVVIGGQTSAQQPAAEPLDVLLTNDDGWRGEGGADTPLIVALRDALVAAGHHVVVVAPGTDQTGQSGRISLPPIELEFANPEPDVWTVTPGSPSDSVYFALDEVFGTERPDIVISGPNFGGNMGSTANHSGTVNAALTGLELGVPAIAVSIELDLDWAQGTFVAADPAADFVAELLTRLQATAGGGPLMPEGLALNVNFPVIPGPVDAATGEPSEALAPDGAIETTLATGPGIEFDYSPVDGGAGAPGTYSIGIALPDSAAADGTDLRAVADGYISVTPMEADRDTDEATSDWLTSILDPLG